MVMFPSLLSEADGGASLERTGIRHGKVHSTRTGLGPRQHERVLHGRTKFIFLEEILLGAMISSLGLSSSASMSQLASSSPTSMSLLASWLEVS